MPAYEFTEMESVKTHARYRKEEELPKRLNYWGYTKAFHFAPKRAYAATKDPVREFKDMVKTMHRLGIEVLMEFYFPEGCSPRYITECLQYWVQEYHVDGFHVRGVQGICNLMATDPLFADTKLLNIYFPVEEIYGKKNLPKKRMVAECNDGFMIDVRRFLKGDEESLKAFAERMRRNPKGSGLINYIASHDGFTLCDLVSYEERHNEDNGEQNRDGRVQNYSWNCGEEGKSRKKKILELRNRQMKNAWCMLLLSAGTPMILAGDESEEIQTETQQSEPDETDPEDTKEKDQDLDEKAAQREKEKEKAKDKKDSSKSEKDAMSEQKFDERFEKLVIDPEELEKSFRFETVAKEYALAKADLKIYTAKNSHADVAGTLAKDGLCYILWKGKNWSYVESGNVRGYVKNKNVLTGEVVRVKVALKKEGFMTLAKAKIDPKENPAYASVKKTIQETVVKRVNAVAKENELNVREEKSTDARVVGVIPQGGLCYILADQGQEWCYVESGDVRGFVKSELLLTGKEADAIVKATKRKNMTLATEEIRPEENRALYYTFTSTQKAHSEKVKYLGKFKLTAYCACQICCGEFANGITASGTVPIQGQTVAMYGVPFGTKLIVDDVVYTVEDRGTPYGHIDIYMVDHEAAAAFGTREADVYLGK